mmetsp:Transcript_40786/g.113384  ORF Transcript_40786/g.113384 Transcript_40786/m.113384 type:complete len:314 (+) Transcript_40786:288-1229(+)
MRSNHFAIDSDLHAGTALAIASEEETYLVADCQSLTRPHASDLTHLAPWPWGQSSVQQLHRTVRLLGSVWSGSLRPRRRQHAAVRRTVLEVASACAADQSLGGAADHPAVELIPWVRGDLLTALYGDAHIQTTGCLRCGTDLRDLHLEVRGPEARRAEAPARAIGHHEALGVVEHHPRRCQKAAACRDDKVPVELHVTTFGHAVPVAEVLHLVDKVLPLLRALALNAMHLCFHLADIVQVLGVVFAQAAQRRAQLLALFQCTLALTFQTLVVLRQQPQLVLQELQTFVEPLLIMPQVRIRLDAHFELAQHVSL